MRLIRALTVTGFALAASGLVPAVSVDVLRAADLLPADRPIEEAIDHYISERLTADKVTPAAQCDDAGLIRRLTLDLAGRTPATAETRSYVESVAPARRAELVDRLLASPDFVFHQRNELDALLMRPRPGDGEFRKYLTWAVEQNRAWDDMFRDMLIGQEQDEHQNGALTFVTARVRELNDLTNDTAVLFFGVNVSCAQCHDHPLADDWKQDHFYGMQSFFSRTFLTKKNRIREKPYGEVKFTTTKGVEKQAAFMFLTGASVEEPKTELTPDARKQIDELVRNLQQKDDAPELPALPFSPRARLVELSLAESNNRFFARNIANRLWHRLTGRGLVHPPDQLHSANPASHPELLDWLARDLVAHRYDLKRLMRGIVLSQAYSRSSVWESNEAPPGPELFALASARALSPRQYALSLLIASANPEQMPGLTQLEPWKQRREQLENASGGWAGSFEPPGENFQIAVDEALLLSNSARVDGDLLRDSGDRLVGHLKTLKEPADAVTAASWATLNRAPQPAEAEAMLNYLKARPADQPMAIRQVVWALLTHPELRFNH